MCGKPKTGVARAVFNSTKAKIMVRRLPQPRRVKVVFTLKKRFIRDGDNFDNGGGDENFEKQFQKLQTWLANMNFIHSALFATAHYFVE